MTVTKDQVISLHRANPTLTCREIADRLGCGAEYVRKTAARNGLTLPSCYGDKNDPQMLRTRARALLHQAQKLIDRANRLEGKP